MSKFPTARESKPFTPAWMRRGRALYGAAFEPKKKSELAESMADWAEMSEEERSFVAAHLQYLGLEAQLGTQKLLRELRALFEEVGDEMIDALEGVADAVEPDGDGEIEIEDGVEGDVVDGEEPEGPGRHLELVEDTPVPEYEPEPRVMPVEAGTPELVRDTAEEREPGLVGLIPEVLDAELEPEPA